jgi:Bacterial aa3 type cytochrome c oxidase subunit IV
MAGDMDIQQHRATYESIMKLLFWGAIGCAIVAAVVIWLIA